MSGEKLDITGLDDRLFPALSPIYGKTYVYITNLETNVTRWTKNAAEFMGEDSEYVYDVETKWKKLIHPDDLIYYEREMERVFSGEKPQFDLIYRVRKPDGSYVSCTGSGYILKGEQGEPDLFAGTIINHGVADQVECVTNLWNSYVFNDHVSEILHKNKSVSIFLIGIMKYSHINDTYGYKLGNKLLKQIADKFFKFISDDIRLYKLDGAKFGFCCVNTGEDEIRNMYDKARAIVMNDLYINGNKVPLRIAGGVTAVKDYDGRVDAVINSASYALELSKHERHGELVFFDNEVNKNELARIERISEIHRSVLEECRGFMLYYQPIISVKRGKIVGAEALLRWENDEYGIVPPDQFIPWLEEDPSIYTLGNWIIENAIKAAKKFKKVIPDFFINVNIAATQLENSEFRGDIIEMVEKLDFPRQNLWIELTERCKDLDHQFLKSEISYFQSNGIQVALDDYGTGASSLSLALELPVAEIKIDRTFTKDVMHDPLKQAIVQSILDFARKTHVRSCIEGIENTEIAEFLKPYGPMYYQGYAYSKPIRENEFMDMIAGQADS